MKFFLVIEPFEMRGYLRTVWLNSRESSTHTEYAGIVIPAYSFFKVGDMEYGNVFLTEIGIDNPNFPSSRFINMERLETIPGVLEEISERQYKVLCELKRDVNVAHTMEEDSIARRKLKDKVLYYAMVKDLVRRGREMLRLKKATS